MFYIFLKLLSESLLSFYPAMVKYINFPLINQLWARLVIYTIISLFFINYKNIFSKIFSLIGLLLAGVNLIHIYSSYLGFQKLDSGVAYSLFYTYPFFILLFSGNPILLIYLLPLVGIIFLTYSSWKEQSKKNLIIGIIAILIASLTETGIYFIVKRLNEKNSWIPLFIAYFLPSLLITAILNKNVIPKEEIKNKTKLVLLLVGNAVIGSLGYFLRFYTINKLSTMTYSSLSYFGIFMAYVYGWILNKELVNWEKIVGSILIIGSGIYLNYNYV